MVQMIALTITKTSDNKTCPPIPLKTCTTRLMKMYVDQRILGGGGVLKEIKGLRHTTLTKLT